MVDYMIEVVTGNLPYADTCEQVHILLIGTKGQSKELELRKSYRDGFAQGQTDRFCLQDIPDLGKLTRVQIKLTPFDLNTSYVKAWYLNLVRISRAEKDNTTFTWTCKCCKWLGTDSGQQLAYILPISTYRLKKRTRRLNSKTININMKGEYRQVRYNEHKLPLAAQHKEI